MAAWVVFKMGGSLEKTGRTALAEAIAWCNGHNQNVAVVHGGGPRISRALDDAGITLPFVNGERVTTDAGMAVVERVLAGEVNAELVHSLQGVGVPAVQLSGAKGLLSAAPIPGRGRTARVAEVAVDVILARSAAGEVPVIAPIGSDNSGLTYNINADLAAGAIAGALGAERVVFLTDVPGIYEDWAAKTLLTDASAAQLAELQEAGRFHHGMIPKVTAVLHALQAGVSTAYVISGANADALSWAVQSDAQNSSGCAMGTRISRQEAV